MISEQQLRRGLSLARQEDFEDPEEEDDEEEGGQSESDIRRTLNLGKQGDRAEQAKKAQEELQKKVKEEVERKVKDLAQRALLRYISAAFAATIIMLVVSYIMFLLRYILGNRLGNKFWSKLNRIEEIIFWVVTGLLIIAALMLLVLFIFMVFMALPAPVQIAILGSLAYQFIF